MKNLVTFVTFGLLIFSNQVGGECDRIDENGSQCYKLDKAPSYGSKVCARLKNVKDTNDTTVTYFLGMSVNCTFSITESNTGNTLKNKLDYEVKNSVACRHYSLLVIKKSYEGQFDFNFSDGNKTSVLLYWQKHTTTINGTVSKTLQNPMPKEVDLHLNPGTNFYHAVQLGCAINNRSTFLPFLDEKTEVNCQSFNFALNISKSMKDHKNEDFIQLTKKFSDACNNMYHGNTKLQINLTINDRDQIDHNKTFKTDVKIHRSLLNMNPRLISVPLTSSFWTSSKIHKCLNLHPNSVHSTSSGVLASFDQSKDIIDLKFNETLKQDRQVTVQCHPDIKWYLVITIRVVDHVRLSSISIGLMASVVFAMCVCLIWFLKSKGYIQINAQPKYKYNEIVARSTIVVNRTESESDADEELERSKDENRLLLEKAFGNRLHKVLKPFKCVKMDGFLGKGHFGKVHHGFLNIGEYTKVEVAIKEAFSLEGKTDLIHEAKTLDRVKRNDYIVNLQGITYNTNHVYLLLEYCANTSVKSFLRKNSLHYTILARENNEYSFLMRCCSQVASGMMFLAENGIKHCDLAARNVLVTHDLHLKIADFGLSERDYNLLLPGSRTAKSETTVQPIAWLPYEVLRNKDKVYASDVWSFGVYMWEVFEFGYGNPYAHMKDQGALELDKLMKFLEDGNRLAMPELCPDEVFQLMKECWELDPKQRPSFQNLKERLEFLAYKIAKKEISLIYRQSQTETEYTSVSSPKSLGTQETQLSYAGLHKEFEWFEMNEKENNPEEKKNNSEEKENNPDSTLPVICIHSPTSQSKKSTDPPTQPMSWATYLELKTKKG